MMVPALLFIEKPYYDNLLATGTSSPFHRKSGSISLIYMVMVLKKCCVLWVNWQLIFHDDCGDSKADSGSVCLDDGGTESWSGPAAAPESDATDGRLTPNDDEEWYHDQTLVPQLAGATCVAHALIFIASQILTHMGGTLSSGTGHDDDESDGDESDDDEPPP